MRISEHDIERVLSTIVDAINASTETTLVPDPDRRAESRRAACIGCQVRVLARCDVREHVVEAVIRNSSFKGLSIVARMPNPIRKGLPVEVKVGDSHLVSTYLAGTVAFCRALGIDYYEVGVDVKATGSNWILANDMETARARYDWFDEALQEA